MATEKLTSTLSPSLATALTLLLTLDSDAFTELPIDTFVRRHASCFYVNEPAYGAVGDGITDDTAAIQACINAAEAYSLANNTAACVIFPAGIFLVSNTLTVKVHNVHLIGAGGGNSLFVNKGTCILPTTNFPNGQYVLRFDWINYAMSLFGNHMEGISVMVLDASYTLTNTVHGVYWGVAKGLMRDVYIYGMTGTGLGIEGFTGFSVIETLFLFVRVRACGHGMDVIGACSDNWFLCCQFQSCVTGAGIARMGANDYYICCHFTGNLNNVRSGGRGTEELFLGCNFESPREHNILLDSTGGGAIRLRFVACQINSNALTAANTYDSIFITGGGGTFSGVISDSTFTSSAGNAPRYHINLSNASASGIKIDNCTFGAGASGVINHPSAAVRCTVDGLGRNAGNPNIAGNWLNQGRHGVRVWDDTGTTIYECYDGTNWVALN